MSKKYFDSYYDETDEEDYILLGSRLYRAIQGPAKPPARRLKNGADRHLVRENWSRPQPARVRD